MQFINDLNYLTKKGITMDRGYDASHPQNGHGYGFIYNRYFSELNFKKILKVLEIGVSDRDSQIFWKLYFIQDYTHKEQSRIHIFQGNQAKRGDLQRFIDLHGSNFDIIIDDGGHHQNQQQISFGFLFPHLKAGGLYICEDLFTSHDSFRYPMFGWLKNYPSCKGLSALAMFKQLETYGITDSYFMTRNEEKYIDKNIDCCKIEMQHIRNCFY